MAIPQGARVKIEFLQSGGRMVPVADNLASPGRYSWKIGPDAYMWKAREASSNIGYGGHAYAEQGTMLETQGKLRLTALYEGGKRAFGESAVTLGIPELKITSPRDGDEWHAGETHVVTWQSRGLPARMNIEVQIGNQKWIPPIVSSKGANSGSRSITIPAELQGPPEYRLGVMGQLPGFPDTAYVAQHVSIKITN